MQATTIEGFRLSPQQRRLCAVAGSGATASFRARCTVRILGALDVEALRRSLDEVSERQEVLRIRFRQLSGMAEPVQVIAAAAVPSFAEEDLSSRSGRQQQRRIAELLSRPIAGGAGSTAEDDPDESPLRVSLLRLSSAEHVLLLDLPALCADDAALILLSREIARAYGAAVAGSPERAEDPIQYPDVAEIFNQLVDSEDATASLAFWQRQLPGAGEPSHLPGARDRPPAASGAVGRVGKSLDRALTARLEALATERGSDLEAVLATAWHLLLGRLSDHRRPVVGHKLAGRNYEGLEDALGLFARYLPLAVELGTESSFTESLASLRAAVADVEERQEYFAWNRLPGIDGSGTPFLPFCFDPQPRLPSFEAGGLSFSVSRVEAYLDRFELLLRCRHQAGELRLELLFDEDRYTANYGARLLEQLAAVLTSAAGDPRIGELDFLGPAQRQRLLVDWNVGGAPATARSIHQLFEAQAERTPRSVAVVSEDATLSYGELDARANRVARALAERRLETEEVVAVCLERGADLVAALLGVLKAGAAFVPLDPSHPRDRLDFMLRDAGVRCVLTQRSLARALPWDDERVLRLETLTAGGGRVSRPAFGPRQLAYVLYTSGSTGRPKGVMVSHGSLANYLRWVGDELIDERVEIMPLVTWPTFDAALKQLFAPLLHGGRVWTLTPETLADPRLLLAALAGQRGIGLNCVVSMWRTMLGAWDLVPQPPSSENLVALYVGGERLEAEDLRRTFARFPEIQLWNLYGPTELTANASAGRLTPGSEVHLGRPLRGCALYLLDRRSRPVPAGLPGEICASGAGVARGYRSRPSRTAECFVPDPMGRRTGARLYKTGDLGRFSASDRLEFLGRRDHQVKLRGIRIELEEVEAALRDLPAVADCAVALRRIGPGEPRLVAYVVLRDGASASTSELRGSLQKSLPEALLPTHFVRQKELPRSSAGKIDRPSLPEPDLYLLGFQETYHAPRTATEEVLAGLWAELLGVGQVGLRDHFFALGGHSLLTVQLLSRIQQAFGLEVPLQAVLEAADLEDMAARIDHQRHDGTGAAPPIQPAARGTYLPLSLNEERLWFLELLRPGRASYVIPATLRFKGPFDAVAMARGFREVLRRHQVLRTRFETRDGRAARVVCAPRDVPLSWIDLRGLGPAARRAETSRQVTAESRTGFDLAAAPPLRVLVLRTGDDEGILSVTMHHIISDGWSLRVLLREIAALYEAFSQGRPSPLPELPFQYSDYAVWQRAWLRGEVLERHLEVWRRRLAGLSPTALPADRPRPAMPSDRGETVIRPLASDLEALNALSRRHGVTLHMTLLAAFKATLHFLTRSADITLGTNAVNRHRAGTEQLIGFFVNQLVQRTDLSGDPTFRELLARVRKTALEAYDHQELPFNAVVKALQPERDLRQNPLFQIIFAYQNLPSLPQQLAGIDWEPLAAEGLTSAFDLIFYVDETPDGLRTLARYSTELYDAGSIERLRRGFETVLRQVTERPDIRLNGLASALEQTDLERQAASAVALEAAAVRKLRNRRRSRRRVR